MRRGLKVIGGGGIARLGGGGLSVFGGGGAVATPWYLAGEVAAANCIGAYAAEGADLAATLVNLANPGTHDLTYAVAPTYSPPPAGNGWVFTGVTQKLDTGIVPTKDYSIIAKYSNHTGTANGWVCGSYTINSSLILVAYNAGKVAYYTGAGYVLVSPNLRSGVLSLGPDGQGYRNGIADGAPFVQGWVGSATSSIAIGGLNGLTGWLNGNVQRCAIYDKQLTPQQHLAIANAMLTDINMVITFGDSVTAGTGASDAAHRWSNIVATAKNKYLINSGVGSTILQNTVQNSIATLGAAANSNGRDTVATRITNYFGLVGNGLIYILYGLNDIRLNDAAITVENFQNDLGEIVDAIVAAGNPASNIVIGSPSFLDYGGTYGGDGAPWNGATAIKHAAYVAACAAVASAKGTKYVDVFQYMADNGGAALMADKVHPNDAGHATIAAAFLSVT